MHTSQLMTLLERAKISDIASCAQQEQARAYLSVAIARVISLMILLAFFMEKWI